MKEMKLRKLVTISLSYIMTGALLQASPSIRVMSYNIYSEWDQFLISGFGNNWERNWHYFEPPFTATEWHRSQRVIGDLKWELPDIACFQEGKWFMVDDFSYAVAANYDRGDGERLFTIYNPLKYSVLDQGVFKVAGLVNGHVRKGTYVKFRENHVFDPRRGIRYFFVFNVHLHNGSQAVQGLADVMATMRQVNRGGSLITILMGDFNLGSGSLSSLSNRSGDWATTFRRMNADGRKSYHNWQGGIAGSPIDHIFIYTGMSDVGFGRQWVAPVTYHARRYIFGFYNTTLTGYSSDHYRVAGDIHRW